MRISLTGSLLTSGEAFAPVDPPRPIPIDDLFRLEFLRASPNPVEPFRSVTVEWSISELQPADFPGDRFVFELVGNGDAVAEDVPLVGSTSFAPYGTTSLRITVRGRGSGNLAGLRGELLVRLDEENCTVVELPGRIVDAAVADFAQVVGESASLRLRRVRQPSPDGVGSVEEQLQVVPTWELGKIGYHFPLELVLDNFFNGNLDVWIEIRFLVHHAGRDTDLEVAITHRSNLDFDTGEDILSLGHTATIASTTNRLLPLLLDSQVAEMERTFLRLLLGYLAATDAAGKRLLSVRVDPTENFERLTITACADG